LPRAALAARFPVHATWRMDKGVWNLRSRRSFRALAPALYAGAEREGFRLVHYAIMGNHIHLLVEASDRTALMRGMQGLGVRVARRLNRLMTRSGRVVADRYHARVLRTPVEVRNARRYLLTNARHHFGVVGADDYASQTPLVVPHTWLLRRHC